MSKSHSKSTTLAACTVLASGIVLAGSAFAMQPLAQGYLLAAPESSAAPAADGKTGEGKCGVAKADADKDGKVSAAEFSTAHPDAPADKFASIDTNKDGFLDAAEVKAHHGAKGADGKCGEGKCGEGKCGAEAGDKKADDKTTTP